MLSAQITVLGAVQIGATYVALSQRNYNVS